MTSPTTLSRGPVREFRGFCAVDGEIGVNPAANRGAVAPSTVATDLVAENEIDGACKRRHYVSCQGVARNMVMAAAFGRRERRTT